jgi:hypothetical protein
MTNASSLITIDWLIPKVLIGISIGYLLRIIEHIIWASKSPTDQNPLGNFRFSLMILPQCFLFGAAIGGVLIAILAIYIDNWIVIEITTYALPALTSFLAVDLRDLIRRISRI